MNGSNFVSGAVVYFNGVAETTTFVNSSQLTAAIPASAVTTSGTVPVKVTNPSPGGGTSNSLNFTVKPATVSNPVPTVTSVSASSATAGGQGFTLTVKGANFVKGAVVSFNGIAVTTTFVSATEVTGAITAANIANAGTVPVTVTNPAPGGGTSNSVSFAINAAVTTAPVVTLTPASLTFSSTTVGATAAAQTVTLSNTGNAALTIAGISIAGTNANAFTETNTCGSSLGAGGSCSISVAFTPVATGSSTATLSIADNAANSPQNVPLSGTGSSAPTPTFSISSTTATQAVQPGAAAQYTITVAAVNGAFPNAVALSASGLPDGATVSFTPATVTPGSTSATSQMTVQTAAATAAVVNGARRWTLATCLPLAGLLFAARKRRRRWMALCFLLVASVGAVVSLSACGGGSSSSGGGTQAHAYTISVTGTSGSIQQSTTVQRTVQ